MSRPTHATSRHLLGRILKAAAIVMSLVLFGALVTGWLAYRHLNSNITHPHLSEPVLPSKAPPSGHTVNYLIIGSDNRQVPGGHKYGHADYENLADTVILAHLPADGRSARLVSFPRDGLVTIPECKHADGTVVPEHLDKFNASYAIGGPACTIKTVESMSHIRIDDFIVVSLPGFVKISNALGGVEVCLPQDVADPKSKLYLSAGRHKIQGETALAFVREREQLGGSRIRRQQEFLAGAIKAATSTHLLTNPFRLYHLLDVSTKAISTGKLGLNDLRKLAERFRDIKPGNVSFYTVPTFPETRQVLAGYDNPDGVYVDPIDTATADALFQSIEDDQPVPVPTPTTTTTPSLSVPPSSIPVRVLNGNGDRGAANAAADDLRTAGFVIASVGDADSSTYQQTVVRYGPTRKQSSQTLAAAVPGAVRQYDPDLGDVVELIVGSDYTGAHSVQVEGAPTPSATPQPIESFNGSDDPCKANTPESGPA